MSCSAQTKWVTGSVVVLYCSMLNQKFHINALSTVNFTHLISMVLAFPITISIVLFSFRTNVFVKCFGSFHHAESAI